VGRLDSPGGLDAAPYDEDPEPVGFAFGGACVVGDALEVDLDLDGRTEAFSLAELAAGADELTARPGGAARCEPAFAGPSIAPEVALVGVVDADGDGRFELVVSYRDRQGVRWAVYATAGRAGRMERVGVELVLAPAP
jgi:hypothetical protein